MLNWTSSSSLKTVGNISKKEKEIRTETNKKDENEDIIFDDYSSNESSRKSEEDISCIGEEIEEFLSNFYQKNIISERKILEFNSRTIVYTKDLNSCQQFLDDFIKINSIFVEVSSK